MPAIQNPTEDAAFEVREPRLTAFSRVLSRIDLLLLCLVSTVNLNLLPAIAAHGVVTLILWALVVPLFVLPQGIAIVELTRRCPGESGLAQWSSEHFGNFVGFLTAWCYWANNIVYVPSLALFLVGNMAFLLDPSVNSGHQPIGPVILLISLGTLWVVVGLCILGLGTTRWLSNAGGMCIFLCLGILAALSISTIVGAGPSRPAPWTIHEVDLRAVSTFSVLCLSMVGIELGGVFGDEIRSSRAAVPWSVWRASSLSVVCYLVGLVALLTSLPADSIGAVPGILEATDAVVRATGRGWVTTVLGLLVCLSVAGSAVAWTAGASRMLWFASSQGALPASLSTLHPRFRTPATALVLQGLLSSIVLVASLLGPSSHRAYLLLLDLTVVLQLIPYLTMFAGLAKASWAPSTAFRWSFRFAGIVGALATLAGMLCAFLPIGQDDPHHLHEVSLIAGCGLILATGGSIYVCQGRSQLNWRGRP